uniref:tRNA-dihydrouridine(47) synthase [NAD(P)(+)] n=1 Tax=Steinernema glaseri TaxID=37863 RepID=A0A1I8AQ73_9BILA
MADLSGPMSDLTLQEPTLVEEKAENGFISASTPDDLSVQAKEVENGTEVAVPPKEEVRKVGYAPIKKEYLLDFHAVEKQIEEAVDSEEKPQNLPTLKPDKSSKKYRGMDRQRGKKMAKGERDARAEGVRLCLSVVHKDRDCKYGKRCTSEHDLDTYLEKKPADLGDKCPTHEATGQCPYKWACRFGEAHTDPETKEQITKEPPEGYVPTINGDMKPIQIALRKRGISFAKTDEIVKTIDSVGAMDREKPRLKMKELSGKPYLAPLTTVGNLPFRRLCVDLGCEITCGEMAVATSLLSGAPSEWALVKRHPSEKIFGVQIAGGFADTLSRATQLLVEHTTVDFIDINMGCPIELINEKGGGCSLATRHNRLVGVLKSMSKVMGDMPLTVKIRTGIKEGVYTAHNTITKMVEECPPQLITLHPRSKEQRYTKMADWGYVNQCAEAAKEVPLWVCGDVLSYEDYYKRLEEHNIGGIMIGRGALIKPWLFTEIQERRYWDISATERLDIVKQYVDYGLEHWGSDDAGVEKTRRFLLEWLSFTCRYVPVGLLEVLPPCINHKPPLFRGRNELETLLSSQASSDWVKISEMFLGKAPEQVVFVPKHRANAY